MPNKDDKSPSQVLRRHALRHPDTTVGIACEGTALEKATIKVGKKAFVFLGRTDAMLKLDASLSEATKLAVQSPGRFKVGAYGWVTASLAGATPATMKVVQRWIDESYALFAPATPTKAPARRRRPTSG